MSIGIIGAGNLGSNFARALAHKDIPAMISSRRGPNALRELTSQIGASIRPVSVSGPEQQVIFLVPVSHWSDGSFAPAAGLTR
jgi:8-hydroxy-5-deazaflavin:NADPH oxidoreductase